MRQIQSLWRLFFQRLCIENTIFYLKNIQILLFIHSVFFIFLCRRKKVDVFVVRDAMIFGKGVFGIFSTLEKATSFKDEFENESKYFCEINKLSVIGSYEFPDNVFAAHTYDLLYDIHTLDGVYAEQELAFEAVGDRGLIVEFAIDMPEKKQIKICG
jgi:hypothetical protein